MNLTSCQINLYIIFVLIILLITLYYSINNNSINNNSINNNSINNNSISTLKNIESFEISDPNTTDVTVPNITISKPIIKLNDTSVQNIINSNISKLSAILNKYTNLDAPIIINNNKTICDAWGDYNNGKYNLNTNQCLIEQGQRSCISNKTLVSCSNYYDDGKINTHNNIDPNNILKLASDKISLDYNNINIDIIEKTTNIYSILNNLIDKRNLENQQLHFIEYNNSNINDKQKLVDKSTDEFEKEENNVKINQMNFSIFLDQNNNSDSKKNLYYKILLGIIITIIIIGMLNLLFSELL